MTNPDPRYTFEEVIDRSGYEQAQLLAKYRSHIDGDNCAQPPIVHVSPPITDEKLRAIRLTMYDLQRMGLVPRPT